MTADGPSYTASETLGRAERKALRVVTRAPFGTSNEELDRRAGITPLVEKMKMLKANAVSRFDNNNCSTELLFIKNSII